MSTTASKKAPTPLLSKALISFPPPKMVSLWGSKNDGEEERDGGDAPVTDGDGGTHDNPRHSDSHDADERTRLLPRRHEGYLSPDDPAVSFSLSVKRRERH